MKSNMRASKTDDPDIYILEVKSSLGLWSEVLDLAGNTVYLDIADVISHNLVVKG